MKKLLRYETKRNINSLIILYLEKNASDELIHQKSSSNIKTYHNNYTNLNCGAK